MLNLKIPFRFLAMYYSGHKTLTSCTTRKRKVGSKSKGSFGFGTSLAQRAFSHTKIESVWVVCVGGWMMCGRLSEWGRGWMGGWGGFVSVAWGRGGWLCVVGWDWI